jgi:hypothetical protein
VFMHWLNETIAACKREMEKCETSEQKLMCAFEIWAVHPFEMMMRSPEAKELIECSFGFAQDSIKQGYKIFEAAIVPVVASLARRNPARRIWPQNRLPTFSRAPCVGSIRRRPSLLSCGCSSKSF